MQAPSDERYIYNKWVSSFNGLFLLFHFVAFCFYQHSYVRMLLLYKHFHSYDSYVNQYACMDSLISFHTQLLTWHFNHHSKVQSFMVAYSIDQSMYCHRVYRGMQAWTWPTKLFNYNVDRNHDLCAVRTTFGLWFYFFKIKTMQISQKCLNIRLWRERDSDDSTTDTGWKTRFQQKWNQTEIVVLIQTLFSLLP